MADVVKTTKEVVMVAEFSDGSEKTLSHADPKAVGTIESAINDLQTYAKNNNIFLTSDGASFVRFSSAKIRNKEQIYFDIT